MIFKEFGDKRKPTVMFIHSGGLSWWSWKPQIAALQKDYHVVAPVLEGHGEAWETVFTDIRASADQIVGYIEKNCSGKVFAICGLSIGAQIIVEILSRKSDIAENAVVESALVYPIKMITALTVPMFSMCYGLIKKEWYAKLQAKSLYIPDLLFADYFLDSSRMSKESLINMIRCNGDYMMPASLGNIKAKVLIVVGEKELRIMKKSAKLLYETIEGSFLKVVEKGGHGEISLKYPEKYLDLILNFFAKQSI